jgi:hypothetical protein
MKHKEKVAILHLIMETCTVAIDWYVLHKLLNVFEPARRTTAAAV